MKHPFTSLIKGLSIALLLSTPAQAWVAEADGISNDFFYLSFKNVSYGSHVTESQFKQSVGNVIDYWQDLLQDNHDLSGEEKIQVDVSFSDLGDSVLGSAGYKTYSNVPDTFLGYENLKENTTQLTKYDYYTTHTGTQFTAITGAQAKLLGYGDVAGSEADFTINFNNTQQFYYGDLADKPSSLFDFESVLLHEIAHGMGVASALQYDTVDKTTSLEQYTTTSGLNILDTEGNPLYHATAWDSLIGIDVLETAQPGDSLTITADTVSFDIFNPNPWKEGSSLSHPIVNGVLNHSISNLNSYRSFTNQELYLLEGLGYDIAGIEFTSTTVPEPSSAALSLLALPFLLARRRRRR